jgi:hypothetical protein
VPAILCSFNHFWFATNFVVYCQSFLPFMSVNLLRHHLFMFCYAFGSYIFLCHPFYCVIQFTVCGALLFVKIHIIWVIYICKPFYVVSIIFKLYVSHFVLCKLFYNLSTIFYLLAAILCYVNHFILYQSFYLFCLSYFICASYFRFF